jgi:hypothetical protein
MLARLGRVIYWATCLIACGLVVVGVIVGISGEWEVFALSLVSIPVYLFGLACLYIFSNEAPKWHRTEKAMALVATLGVASFSIVMIDSQMDKATPEWMDAPIVEESAGSEKTSLNEGTRTITIREVDYDPFAGEKSEEKFHLDPMPRERLETMSREEREGMTLEEIDARIEVIEELLKKDKQEQERKQKNLQ